MQRLVFGALAPIARLRGLRGRYPGATDILDEIEALPPGILAQLPPGVPPGTAADPPPAVRQ